MDKLKYLLSRKEALECRADLYGEDLSQELRELVREILIQSGEAERAFLAKVAERFPNGYNIYELAVYYKRIAKSCLRYVVVPHGEEVFSSPTKYVDIATMRDIIEGDARFELEKVCIEDLDDDDFAELVEQLI